MNAKINIILFLLIISGANIYAQELSDADIKNTSDVVLLQQQFEILNAQRLARVHSYISKNGLSKKLIKSDGTVIVLHDVSREGKPIYIKSDNLEAAITTGADRLWSGGGLGLNLSGKNMSMGIWEAGGVVRDSHVELKNRVQNKDGGSFTTHATHVAGTMIASGVNPLAKGMAYEASLLSYDASGDNSEMIAEAANNMLISNHSYGRVSGWNDGSWFGDQNISTIEDYGFGFYDGGARSWDVISRSAPYYLIVKSAGNERGDSGDGSHPPDGPYDCIGWDGNAKNILTVGAVNPIPNRYTIPSSVVMSSFSSWGPTDDGRIKPDIVANGVSVFSSVNGADDSYGSLQGTSMSAPNASGSLLLLQELYSQYNGGEFMKSATLKGLAIHTASEAGGFDGPDYVFGWGLLNVVGGANMIEKNGGGEFSITEEVIVDGNTFEHSINANIGDTVTVTICWTDLPGTSPAPSLDPVDLMLVNDLDLRVLSPSLVEFNPWILDPTRPAARAEKGDNFRDNVEKVTFIATETGAHTIRVTHKGSIEESSQDFSMISSVSNFNNVARALYWIGESGNWNDGNNWSVSTGGSPAGVVPDAASIVYFDDNSFGDADTVVVSNNVELARLFWNSDESAYLDINANTLSVSEHFYALSDVGVIGSGTIALKGVEGRTAFVSLQGIDPITPFNLIIGNSAASTKPSFLCQGDASLGNVSFELGSISWRNASILNADRITIERGTELELPFDTVNTAYFTVADATGLVEGKQIEFVGLTEFDVNLLGSNSLDSLTLTFTGNLSKLYSDNSYYNSVDLEGDSTVISGSGNTFGAINISSNVSINSTNTYGLFSVVKGYNVMLNGGSVQNITNELNVESTESEKTSIYSSSTTPSIISSTQSNKKYCLDHVIIDNVEATGGALFVAGLNSTLSNSTSGWIEDDCDNVFFADFGVSSVCKESQTQFTDLSTGGAVSWSWDFGDSGSSENTSTLQNPTHKYIASGDYTISLDILDVSGNTKRQEKTVTIVDGSLIVLPNILVSGINLRTSFFLQNIQWLLDGIEIPGATGNSYTATTSGDYSLKIVSSEGCLYFTNPVFVTSLENTEFSKLIDVFPNPSNGSFNLEIASGRPLGSCKIAVYNILGSKTMETEIYSSDSNFSTTVDLTGELPGYYFLYIETELGVAVKKILLN